MMKLSRGGTHETIVSIVDVKITMTFGDELGTATAEM